jgi:hypothetical protein
MSLLVICPHCQCSVEIVEINCAIFRHAVLKQNGQQLNPHASKEECEQLAEQGAIYGCGKPFRLVSKENNEYEAIVCDYI